MLSVRELRKKLFCLDNRFFVMWCNKKYSVYALRFHLFMDYNDDEVVNDIDFI